MPVKFYENERPTDGFQTCKCGKETLGCSIHPNTPDEWVASMRDSHARICQSLESRPDLEKALGAGFTEKSCELLASLDQSTSSWKMCRQLSILDLEQSLQTLPRWGMTVDGSLYAHPMSERRITGTGGGACVPDGDMFATPNTMDSLPPKSPEALHREATVTRPGRSKPSNLRDQVSNMQMWPTPRAGNPGSRPNGKGGKILAEEVQKLSPAEGGKLSPTWVAWLMGWPLSHTQTQALQTGGSKNRKSAELPQDASTEPHS